VNILSRKIGKGRIIILGFVPYQGYTNLHFNPNFVQMMLRLFWEARHWQNSYTITGNFDEWKKPGLNRDHTYTLRDKYKNQWDLSIDGLGENTRLLIPSDLKFGFYSIREAGNDKQHDDVRKGAQGCERLALPRRYVLYSLIHINCGDDSEYR